KYIDNILPFQMIEIHMNGGVFVPWFGLFDNKFMFCDFYDELIKHIEGKNLKEFKLMFGYPGGYQVIIDIIGMEKLLPGKDDKWLTRIPLNNFYKNERTLDTIRSFIFESDGFTSLEEMFINSIFEIKCNELSLYAERVKKMDDYDMMEYY